MTGEWPADELDHRNGVKDDNRWGNLREADGKLNQENRQRANQNNQCGVLGVSPCGGKFVAQIRHMGRHKNLGLFATPELAHAAYLKAKRALHVGNTL